MRWKFGGIINILNTFLVKIFMFRDPLMDRKLKMIDILINPNADWE